ncbi:tyrosinase precursor [Seiridium cupressi]
MAPLSLSLFLFILLHHVSPLAALDVHGTYDYGHNVDLFLRKRDINPNDSQNALVEALPYNGSVPLRPELRELQENHEQWTLYILAVGDTLPKRVPTPPQNSKTKVNSNWETGIHGAPFADYGGVKALPGNGGNGYCTHVSNLFPPWHRPYLALYEQTIYKVVQMIAAWYPDDRHDTFQKAAQEFRIPYWDWAVKPPNGTSVFPLAVGGSPKMEVDGPNGKQNISNPLFSYTFKPLDPSIFDEFPFMYWNETKRRPIPLQGINATSDNGWVAETLDKSLPSIQQRLYTLFANTGDYNTWSNEAWIPDGSNSSLDSIESLHDTIHLASGGNFGHMAIIAYSSFDPVFFLHHANVDRLFAMWQVVYNDSWLEPMKAILPTRTINAGDNQTSLTDLTPFYHNATHFWNSDQVRDHKVFGYSYADVVSGNRSDVIAAINRLYTDYSPATIHLEAQRSMSPEGKALGARLQPRSTMESVVRNGTYREWNANINVNKFALRASFAVHLFFGQIPKFLAKWELADNKIGTLGIFAGGQGHEEMSPLQIGGTIPLTSALIGLVTSERLPSLDPEDVGPFLRQNLGLAVMHNNGSAIDLDAVDGLQVSIVSCSVAVPKTNMELTSWGGVDTQFDLY